MPDLILLDINLPKVNGHEVLSFIKNNDTYKHIPVIMLTSSSSENDRTVALQHQVDRFITKPSNMADFQTVVTSVERFLTNIV